MRPDLVGEILRPLQGRDPDNAPMSVFLPSNVWSRLALPYPRATTMLELFSPAGTHPEIARQISIEDNQIGVRGTDFRGDGVILGAPWPKTQRLPARRQALLDRLGAHLAAAYRLRAALGPVPALDEAEAIFSHAGKLEHLAIAEEWERETGEDRNAAGSGPRSTQPTRRPRPASRALFDGRWSLVRHSDRDGKRFFLALRNAPGVRDQLALNHRERQVVGLIAEGCSSKQITYELGLSPSTVSGHLRSALRKLRLGDVSELVAITATVARIQGGSPGRPPRR